MSRTRLFGLLAVALASPQLVTAEPAVTPKLLSKQQAEQRLLNAIARDKLYPHVGASCILLDLEEAKGTYFLFAVRFNQLRCGGNSPSTLMDRFAVEKSGGAIRYYDAAGPALQPYSWYLAHRQR